MFSFGPLKLQELSRNWLPEMNFTQQTVRRWLQNERCTIIDYDSHVRTHLEKSLTSHPFFRKWISCSFSIGWLILLTTPVGSKCGYVLFKQFNKIWCVCVFFKRNNFFWIWCGFDFVIIYWKLFYSSMYFFFFWKNRKKHGGTWASPCAHPWASLGFVYTPTFEWHLLQLR